MNDYEKDLLNQIEEKVLFCLQKGLPQQYIAEQLDDVIAYLPEDSSSELFSIIFRIQDNLLMSTVDNIF